MIADSIEEVEQAVLAAALLDKEAPLIIFEILKTTEAFSVPQNRLVAEAVEIMHSMGENIDVLTVAHKLKALGTYQKAGGAKYLAKLASKISSAAHVEIHCRIVLESFLRAGVDKLTSTLLMRARTETVDVFEAIQETQRGLELLVSQNIPMSERSMAQMVDAQRKKREMQSITGLAGLSTGFRELDKRTGGFTDTDLFIVGGRPGSGKTSWMVTELVRLGREGIPAGVFSIEMSAEQILERMTSNYSSVPASKIRHNNLDSADRARLDVFEPEIARFPILIDDSATLSSQNLRTKAHIWHKKHGIKILFVDYLQKISATGRTRSMNREQELSEVSTTLKVIAKELNIPVVCLVSLNRETEKRSDKVPVLSDIRECGQIESDADVVLFFMRPEYYGMTGTYDVGGQDYPVENLALVSVAKNRHGEVGEFPLGFHGAVMRFTNHGETESPPIPFQKKTGADHLSNFENNPF